MKNRHLLKVAFIALFAAIVCIGCFLRIPLGPIPIVLQNGLCILTGALLGSYLGGAPTALFLIAGLIGLPVYAGGTSGVAVWADRGYIRLVRQGQCRGRRLRRQWQAVPE